MTVTSALVCIQKNVDQPFNQSVTDHGSLLSKITPKNLLSVRSGDCFKDEIFFDLHTHWKCPFFPHTLEIASFAGHTPMSWLGLFPHLEHIVCLDKPLLQPVFDILGFLDVFTASIGNCLVSSLQRKTCCW